MITFYKAMETFLLQTAATYYELTSDVSCWSY